MPNEQDERLKNKLKFLELMNKAPGTPISPNMITYVASGIEDKENLKLTKEEILALARLRTFPEFKLLRRIMLESYVTLCIEMPLLPPSLQALQLPMLRAYNKLIELVLTNTEQAVQAVNESFFNPDNFDQTQ